MARLEYLSNLKYGSIGTTVHLVSRTSQTNGEVFFRFQNDSVIGFHQDVVVNTNFSVVRKKDYPNSNFQSTDDVKLTLIFSLPQFFFEMSLFLQFELEAHTKYYLINVAQVYQMPAIFFRYLNGFFINRFAFQKRYSVDG